MSIRLFSLLTGMVFWMTFSSFDIVRNIGSTKFNLEQDLLLAHYDCKTDVDDLHSVAAFHSIIMHPDYANLTYHAVAGAYGEQEGLYVPPNKLFQKAFGENWSDANNNSELALESVALKARIILEKGGDVWIAEAGQSDFSADLVKALQKELPNVKMKQRIHLVQHSDWNEEAATDDKLTFVQNHIDYLKIDDGNFLGNGTPGFNSAKFTDWENGVSNQEVKKVWKLAIKLADRYNGKDGRYLNESIAAGGLDFSDTSEVCWILNIKDVNDVDEFFHKFVTK